MTQARASHLRLVQSEPAPAPQRQPRLRFRPVVRLEDGAPFGMHAEADTAFEDSFQPRHLTDMAMPSAAAVRWQLRVHPAEKPEGEQPATSPFELVLPTASEEEEAPARRLDSAALRAELAALKTTGVARPILAPHADSRSQDLLDAVGILEEVWPDRRRATVAPDLAAK